MTLILTHLSEHGIIHASDSNVTAGDIAAGKSQKTFGIEYLNAGLTAAGSYSVGGARLGSWMNRCIEEQRSKEGLTLGEFAENLRARLEAQMHPSEKESGSLVHIGGYVNENGVSHPEFWFVRNITGIDPETGEYKGISSSFEVSEDFWTRDCPDYQLMEAFQTGGYQIYVNGFPPGRIGVVVLQRVLDGFFRLFWDNPDWAFRRPRSIEESKMLVELDVQIISTLFKLSDYRAPYIGGEVQMYEIPQPLETVTESPARVS